MADQSAYTFGATPALVERILYTHYTPNVVNNTTSEVSALGSGNGTGSLLLPSNYWAVGKRIQLNTKGSYQTPLSPGQVTVKIKVGTVTVAAAVVTASLLATSSNTKALFGEVVISCRSVSSGVARLCADGFLMFGITAGTNAVPFSTGATYENNPALITITSGSGTTPSLATVDYTIANAGAIDVTQIWSNAQSPQGTTITNGKLTEENAA